MLNIGLLDYGANLGATLECSRKADVLGFSRYWLNEHHASGDAWASPELVLTMIAMLTKNIYVGTGGILLNHHNPLRVACDFSQLANAFPNRIDLGVARGAPANISATQMLGAGGFRGTYEDRLEALLKLLAGDISLPPSIPVLSSTLSVWLLGSNEYSMSLAKQQGLAYSHALYLPGTADYCAFDSTDYRRTLFNSIKLRNVAVSGVCGSNKSELARLMKGVPFSPVVSGDGLACVNEMAQIAEIYGVKEVMFLDLAVNLDDRLKSLELLSEAMNSI